MNKPTISQLDNHRREGFRPGAILCLVSEGRILLVFKKEHKLWQLPQGRIANREEADLAIRRIAEDELGRDYCRNIIYEQAVIADFDQMEFKPGRHEVEELVDDQGISIPMRGKVYFFVVLPCSHENLDITKTQYDQFYWMSYQEASFLAQRIYQHGKKRITVKILDKLKETGVIK